ncbi:MAG: hypothetical protein ABIJ23_03755 [Candidatus Magasanikbacteria bacterium]
MAKARWGRAALILSLLFIGILIITFSPMFCSNPTAEAIELQGLSSGKVSELTNQIEELTRAFDDLADIKTQTELELMQEIAELRNQIHQSETRLQAKKRSKRRSSDKIIMTGASGIIYD